MNRDDLTVKLRTRRGIVVAVAAMCSSAFTACSSGGSESDAETSVGVVDRGVAPSPTVPLDGVPDEARVATGTGQPRSAGYWELWSTCAPDNRADVAAANGGADAGWYLVDDLLVQPGIELAGIPVTTCEAALLILGGSGEDTFDGLAAQILASQLSRASGSATCDAADQAIVAGHAVLVQRGYTGPASVAEALDEDAARILQWLRLYTGGRLCV